MTDKVQLRYARWLERGSRAAVAVTVTGFAAYALDLVAPSVDHAQLAYLWQLPLAEYQAATGRVTGWQWVRMLDRSDIVSLGGIALLCLCSPLALAAVLPAYARGRFKSMFWLCLLEIGVLLLAASNVVVIDH